MTAAGPAAGGIAPPPRPIEQFPDAQAQLEGLTARDLPMVMMSPARLIWAAKMWGENPCPVVLVEGIENGHYVQAHALLSKGTERWSKKVTLAEGVRLAKEVLRGNRRTIEDFRTLRAIAAVTVAMAHFADQPVGCIDLTTTRAAAAAAIAEDMDALRCPG